MFQEPDRIRGVLLQIPVDLPHGLDAGPEHTFRQRASVYRQRLVAAEETGNDLLGEECAIPDERRRDRFPDIFLDAGLDLLHRPGQHHALHAVGEALGEAEGRRRARPGGHNVDPLCAHRIDQLAQALCEEIQAVPGRQDVGLPHPGRVHQEHRGQGCECAGESCPGIHRLKGTADEERGGELRGWVAHQAVVVADAIASKAAVDRLVKRVEGVRGREFIPSRSSSPIDRRRQAVVSDL